MVFAHYMTCFALSKEFCKQEIELAQRHGIDGFAMNCGEWGKIDPKTGAVTKDAYIENVENMYEAAKELGTGFKLFISVDMAIPIGDLPVRMGDMVKRFYNHPNQFRYEGKAVISGWAGRPEAYAESIQKIKADGYDICFVPFVFTPKSALANSPESFLRLMDGQSHLDGLFYFAASDNIADTIAQNAMGRRMMQYLGKLYMAGICPAYNSSSLRDFRGAEGYGAIWEGIIQDDADWVEITTWNDYSEDSNLMAYRWKDGLSKELYDRDESLLDVTAYYSAWYKSGTQPKITQDKLYYTYRNRSKWLRKSWDQGTGQWVDHAISNPYDQAHDDVCDFVYATTFLTAPADLTIRIGETQKAFAMPAGIGHALLPMSPGVPHFTITRKAGKTSTEVLDLDGRKLIIAEAAKKDSVLAGRLANRTWTGGAAAGKVLRIEAESGKLTGGAEIIRNSAVTAVKNTEQPDSGFALNIKGLETATYCIRVLYNNPSTTEARLTMTADGVPRTQNEYPYYIPVFLPPTGNDRFASVTFFWSLYGATSKLGVQWKPGIVWEGSPTDAQDTGSVLIDAVELVKVEPVVVPERRESIFPEMILLPGGTFTMGSKNGAPDEQPTHQVTISSFAMSKYEITNEEYEEFDPTHRQFRDGFSWRNREPVIYVSSTDGANYCNWLSRQAGLTPVYDEKTLEPNLKADGFRLATEAEWEYAASGRGEDRTYPWGNEAPDATRCSFTGMASLAVPKVVVSDIGGGTAVVGSYPAGASRDGIMDMAGNVAEWCMDYYSNYSPESQKDPCCLSGYTRVVRGGSWGYYNLSQRCAARNSNKIWRSSVIYYGLRVVVPEAGYRKLAQRMTARQ
jgi:formylglycine-generating enzyme required for sulfatase activity